MSMVANPNDFPQAFADTVGHLFADGCVDLFESNRLPPLPALCLDYKGVRVVEQDTGGVTHLWRWRVSLYVNVPDGDRRGALTQIWEMSPPLLAAVLDHRDLGLDGIDWAELEDDMSPAAFDDVQKWAVKTFTLGVRAYRPDESWGV